MLKVTKVLVDSTHQDISTRKVLKMVSTVSTEMDLNTRAKDDVDADRQMSVWAQLPIHRPIFVSQSSQNLVL